MPDFFEEDSRAKISEIESRIAQLAKELDLLRSQKAILAGAHSVVAEAGPLGKPVAEKPPLTPEDKIKLFLTLFRCRESVFPTLWENPTKGSKGYSPACRNEWVRGVCEKPAVKCSECPNQDFPKLDGLAVQGHLLGKHTIGTYAIREDDTCTFLACDFDGNGWTDDVLAYVEAGKTMGVPIYVERSRSGNGAHAWLFFSEPVEANHARRLGTVILSKAMARRSMMSLKSYDRFFPNQDFLPKGGFGNLIALPLQKKARERGNTEFLREDFTPFENQWDLLSAVRRLSAGEVRALLSNHLPVQSSLLPKYENFELDDAERLIGSPKQKVRKNCYTGLLCIELGAQVRIPIGMLPSTLISAFRRTATFANPEFFKRQAMRFSTWDTPRYICCEERLAESLVLPRGVFETCIEIAQIAGCDVKVVDTRPTPENIDAVFMGELTRGQTNAVEMLSKNEFGLLVAPPGAGKTVMACYLIAQRNAKTLVLVHTKALLQQWKTRLVQFLDIEEKDIGLIGSKSKKKSAHKIWLATLQSLRKREDAQELLKQFGHVIVDECHHIAAVSFESVLKQCPARYVLGLTATPYRKDGHQAIIHMQCGPVRAEMKAVDGVPLRKRVIVRRTSFSLGESRLEQVPIHEVWEKLVSDPGRLELIAADVLNVLDEGRFPIILSERKAHLESLGKAIQKLKKSDDVRAFLLIGGMGKKAHETALEEISDARNGGLKPFILATGSFVGEGFDLPSLDTLILAMPISFKGKLVQYSGRLHRPNPGKSEVRIIDYFDHDNPLTISMFKKRMKTYKLLEYKIDAPQDTL